jgi:hypothetical protein
VLRGESPVLILQVIVIASEARAVAPSDTARASNNTTHAATTTFQPND